MWNLQQYLIIHNKVDVGGWWGLLKVRQKCSNCTNFALGVRCLIYSQNCKCEKNLVKVVKEID